MSRLEDKLVAQIAAAGLPAPVREQCLVPGRRFRCDLVWAGPRVVCEVEGGTWIGGRHQRGGGFANDCEKYNLLQLLGWLVIRVTSAHITSGDALDWVAQALDRHGALGLREEGE